MATTRRDFLGHGLAAGAALPLSRGLAPFAGPSAAGGFRTLVVLEVQGGWDYLNMVVPADHPIYQQVRRYIRIPKAKTLPIQNGMNQFWHPALAAFKELYDRGDLAVIDNVGNPNANLSHFESMNKWHAGDPAVDTVRSGWLGRYIQNYATSALPAISIQELPSEAFVGVNVPTFTHTYSFNLGSDWRTGSDHNLEIAAVRAGNSAATQSADARVREIAGFTDYAIRIGDVFRTVGENYQPAVQYPQNALSPHFKLAARYITSRLPVHVYYLATSDGFDTHSGQVNVAAPEIGVMADGLTRVSGTVKAFLDDLAAQGCGQDVVVMLISEFGRRVVENGSIGTDHGECGVAFLAGQPVRGGRYGQFPDLQRIHKPGESYSLPFDFQSTDFRSLYATVLERWLNAPSAPILGGQQFPLLGAL